MLEKSEPWDPMVSTDEEHLLFQKYIGIFYSKNKKLHLLKIFKFPCILYEVFVLGPFFCLLFLFGTVLLIRTNSITRKLPLIT
jgi:hypothetical protein